MRELQLHNLNVGVRGGWLLLVYYCSVCGGIDLHICADEMTFFFPGRDKMWLLIIAVSLFQGLVNSSVLERRKRGVDPETYMNIVSCCYYYYHFNFRLFQ